MSATRVTGTAAIILALIVIVWHVFAPSFSAGYPHYTATFYVLLVAAFVALFTVIGGLCRIMTAR